MLVTENLTRKYGSFTALDCLSLQISDGELHGFVGPNGAGKTTTMRILATLLPATSGKAYVDGVEVSREGKKIRRMVGYMPDFFGVYDGLKAWEYLDFYARCYAISHKERVKMVDRLLEIVRLSDKKHAYIDVLSRGMKQRLCLARSLIHDPKLLILDEPASGMDPRARAEMKGILRALRDMGKTVVISSHILPEMAELCDAVAIMDRGAVALSGTMEQVLGRSRGTSAVDVQLLRGVDEAVRALKELACVLAVQADGNYLKGGYSGGEEQQAGILGAMTARGASVLRFARNEANLERVFLEVTGSEIA